MQEGQLVDQLPANTEQQSCSHMWNGTRHHFTFQHTVHTDYIYMDIINLIICINLSKTILGLYIIIQQTSRCVPIQHSLRKAISDLTVFKALHNSVELCIVYVASTSACVSCVKVQRKVPYAGNNVIKVFSCLYMRLK